MNASESRGEAIRICPPGELPRGFDMAFLTPEDKASVDRIADVVAERIMQALALLQEHKELYTVEDLVERYGLKSATIKAKILAGEFGDTVNLGAKTRLVTRAGLLAYEAAHTGPAEPRRTSQPPRRTRKNWENPGKI